MLVFTLSWFTTALGLEIEAGCAGWERSGAGSDDVDGVLGDTVDDADGCVCASDLGACP